MSHVEKIMTFKFVYFIIVSVNNKKRETTKRENSYFSHTSSFLESFLDDLGEGIYCIVNVVIWLPGPSHSNVNTSLLQYSDDGSSNFSILHNFQLGWVQIQESYLKMIFNIIILRMSRMEIMTYLKRCHNLSSTIQLYF